MKRQTGLQVFGPSNRIYNSETERTGYKTERYVWVCVYAYLPLHYSLNASRRSLVKKIYIDEQYLVLLPNRK